MAERRVRHVRKSRRGEDVGREEFTSRQIVSERRVDAAQQNLFTIEIVQEPGKADAEGKLKLPLIDAVEIIKHIDDRIVLRVLAKPDLFPLAGTDEKLIPRCPRKNRKTPCRDGQPDFLHARHIPSIRHRDPYCHAIRLEKLSP